jgi:hypothetical protein
LLLENNFNFLCSEKIISLQEEVFYRKKGRSKRIVCPSPCKK